MSRTVRTLPPFVKKDEYDEDFIWKLEKGLATAVKRPRHYGRETWFKENLKLLKRRLRRQDRQKAKHF